MCKHHAAPAEAYLPQQFEKRGRWGAGAEEVYFNWPTGFINWRKAHDDHVKSWDFGQIFQVFDS